MSAEPAESRIIPPFVIIDIRLRKTMNYQALYFNTETGEEEWRDVRFEPDRERRDESARRGLGTRGLLAHNGQQGRAVVITFEISIEWAAILDKQAKTAESRIETLTAENKRLREALEPFARVAGWIPAEWFDGGKLPGPPGDLTVGHFRRAREALTPSDPVGTGETGR